jgi:hypothetical protein
MESTVDVIVDTREKLEHIWKLKYPNDKIPDSVVYLLMEVLKEFNLKFCQSVDIKRRNNGL